MGRIWYFWLERLKINPAERKAVTLLLVLLVGLSLANAFLDQRVPYDEAYYSELDRMFERRAALVKQQENNLLARYQPEEHQAVRPMAAAPSDTLPADSLEEAGETEQPEPAQVDINTAGAEELETLPGIGPVYAQRIIEYRNENGSFSTYEELLKIKGIGKKRLEKLKPFIKLTGSPENQ